MTDINFIHLKVRSEYSLSDSIIKIPQLLESVRGLQMPAVALTDRNNVFATIKFYQEAHARGIKPILGADLLIADQSDPTISYYATCLCQNNQGYKNLLELISHAYLSHRHTDGMAVLTYASLAKYNEGLIILSGAQEGDLGQALLAERHDDLEAITKFWRRYFGGRYYLELRRVAQVNEDAYLTKALHFAQQHNIPVVASNDVRFIKSKDFTAHEARVCIQEGKYLNDPDRISAYTNLQYLRSPAEMQELFAHVPSALTNTVEIAKKCTVKLTLGQYHLPQYPLAHNLSPGAELNNIAQFGLAERLKHGDPESIDIAQYQERLAYELDVIDRMGFAGYFLIVADFVRWSKAHDIPVGPGRGSGVGSLVAYALGITDLDPLVYDLLFERFLNPERISMPDFDIDFCINGRDRVIEYVINKYGSNNVAQIITYGTMSARAVLRDVGRVMGLAYKVVDKLAKLIPATLGITIEQALQQEPLLQEQYDNDPEIQELIKLSMKLEGVKRNVGTHAGGVVIAPAALSTFTALYCDVNHQHLVTQFDKDDVETIGLVKFDFLGLKTLTIIAHAIAVIHQLNPDLPKIDITTLPTDDEQTFALLQSCHTTAIFQLESRGMRELLSRLKPDCFADIMALVALFRPGPLQSGMVDDFINRKHGQEPITYLHPDLEHVLRSTYGVIVYQEQVMQIAQILAGYSLGQADLLRRAMGKKKASEMHKQREIFCQGAARHGVDAALAATIFDLMEKFSGYGFNKSHAAAYAMISYQTAWLKTHHPAAYMAAVLSEDMNNTDKLAIHLSECQRMGISIVPPHINRSAYHFTVGKPQEIIYGLGAIKGLGKSFIEQLLAVRDRVGEYTDLFSFCTSLGQSKPGKRVLEVLIKSGACDLFTPNRASLLASIPMALEHASTSKTSTMQRSLFDNIDLPGAPLAYVDTAAWDQKTALAAEKSVLGVYLSGHPFTSYQKELSKVVAGSLCYLMALPTPPKEPITIAGILSSVRLLYTKKQQKIAVITLDDGNTTIEVTVFADVLTKAAELLVAEQVLIINGTIKLDQHTQRYSMRAHTIYSLALLRQEHAAYLELHLNAAQVTDNLAQLTELLTQHRGGKLGLLLHYYEQQTIVATLKPHKDWYLKFSERLLAELEQLLGPGEVVIRYHAVS